MHNLPFHAVGAGRPTSANEQFKARSRRVFWGAILAAAVAHGLLLWLSPDLGTIPRWLSRVEAMALSPPLDREPTPAGPEYTAPPVAGVHGPPSTREIPRPLAPIVEQEPDARAGGLWVDLLDGPVSTPFEIAPRLKNREATVEALSRLYPADEQGLPNRAKADVWFLIDELGVVRQTLIKESTGYARLDDAVLKVAGLMEFTPAWAGERRVPVWVSIPVIFHNQPAAFGGADSTSAGGIATDTLAMRGLRPAESLQ